MGKRTEVNKVNSLFLVDCNVNISFALRVKSITTAIFLLLPLIVSGVELLNEQFDTYPTYFTYGDDGGGGDITASINDGKLYLVTNGLPESTENKIEISYSINPVDTPEILYFTVKASNTVPVANGGTYDDDGDSEPLNLAEVGISFNNFNGDGLVTLENQNGIKRIRYSGSLYGDAYVGIDNFDEVYLRLSYNYNTSYFKTYYSNDGSNFTELSEIYAPQPSYNFDICLEAESRNVAFNQGEVYYDNFVISNSTDYTVESSSNDSGTGSGGSVDTDDDGNGDLVLRNFYPSNEETITIRSSVSSPVKDFAIHGNKYTILYENGVVQTTEGIMENTAGSIDEISLYQDNLLLLNNRGEITYVGDNSVLANVPLGLGYTSISLSSSYGLAVNSQGEIVAWGNDSASNAPTVSNIPTGSGFVKVATTVYYAVALKADGKVVAWGKPFRNRTNTSHLSDVVDISPNYSHGLALLSDGSLDMWGSFNEIDTINPPSGLTSFISISTSYNFNIAKSTEGAIHYWGAGISNYPNEFVDNIANTRLFRKWVLVPVDSDADGVGDNSDLYNGYPDAIISDFLASEDYVKVSEMQDLRSGSTMIAVENGEATLSMEVEQSDDLEIWTSGGTTNLQIPVDANSDTKFFRFKMTE